MTKINKMLMHGFKSFAKKTELVFGDNFNCVLGPNGSGKCVTGDTLIAMHDGTNIKIKDLVEQQIKTSPVKNIDDGYIAYNNSKEILSLNLKTQKIEKKQVYAFVKRTSPKSLLKITTKSGREITATKYHPLFAIKDNIIQSIKSEELKEGVRIAVPRTLEYNNTNLTFYGLIENIQASDNLYVPFNNKYKEILKSLKKKGETYKKLSLRLNLSHYVLKGLIDGQAINFAHLIKILKEKELSYDNIIDLIPLIKSKNKSIAYNMPWKNSPEFSRFFGYLLAEGKVTDNAQIWFTNGTDKLVKDYVNLVKKLFNIDCTVNEYKPNAYDCLFYSSPIIALLKKFGMGTNSSNKTVSNIYLKNSNNECLQNLLNGLYCGDGYVSKNSIEIISKSKELARNIQTILLKLGITSHLKKVIKIATNTGYSGQYYNVSIFGTKNHMKFSEIELIHDMKNERLKQLINKKSNPNVDLIEINGLIKEITNELKINVKKNKKQFPKLDAYCYNGCTPSREGSNELLTELFIPSSSGSQKLILKQKLDYLSKLVQSDILWDEILSIEEIDSKEKWVYDLSVDINHNFIANNFFIHNSNVMDSLSFVLGKSGAKGMRAEKSANLIYNGGKSKNPAKSGEVSIWFDNTKKTFPIDEKEAKITRIIKQSGQSVYRINDKTVTRQQVLDLLSVAKINPDGYNIILQGDIVRFVEMSPNDRRGIIEEIGGISIYEEKRGKALKQIEKVDERLKESEIVLAERSTYLKELRKERDQAAKFKELDDKIRSNKATLIDTNLRKKKTEAEERDKKIIEAKKNVDKVADEIDKFKHDIDKRKQEQIKINKEVEEKGDKEQVTIQKEIESLKIRHAENKTRANSLINEIDRINERIKQLEFGKKEHSEKLDRLEKQKREYEKRVEINSKDIVALEKKIEDFKRKHNMESATEKEKEIDDLDKGADKSQEEIQKLRILEQNLLREKDQLDFKVKAVDEKMEKVMAVAAENKKELDKLKQMKVEFKKATTELNQRLNEDSSFSAQLSNARNKFLKTQEELSRLNAKNAVLNEKTAGSEATKFILDQRNAIKGIYGTVSELGQTQSKYSTALEVSAGNRIRSIVVENDQIAAKCISLLKQKQLGIATFLPLNKIKSVKLPDNINSVLSSNGVHGLAQDLITYDSKFKTVFSYIFGGAVVVDTIDVSRRIGIGSAKMVTLDGDVSEVSGAMQGGYRKKQLSGGFAEKEAMDDIKRKESESADLSSIISTLEKRKSENEDAIERLRNLKANLEGDIIRIEKSLHLEGDDVDADKKVKKEMEQKAESVEKELFSVQNKIGMLNQELLSHKIKKQTLRAQINELKNPRLLAELNAFEQKKQQVKDDNVKLNAELGSIESQIKTIISPEVENINKIIKQHQKEMDEFTLERKRLSDEIKIQDKEITEKEAKQKKFYTQFKELFNKREKLNQEINQIEMKVIKKEEEIRSHEHKMNAISLENARIKAELSGLEEEFKQYENVKLFKDKPEEEIKREISQFERIVNDIGAVNMKALELYSKAEEEYNKLLEKKKTLVNEREDVMIMMNEIEAKKKELFLNTFDVVNKNFQDIFKTLSTKGEATLDLENEKDPFDGGVTISVRLSSKKFMDIRGLSGGEKTMTALAFIFAIQEHEPASFYVLDEVDAALDKRNAEKLAELVKNYANRAQYLMISHNDGVISEADRLYGVSMDKDGVSKVVTLKV